MRRFFYIAALLLGAPVFAAATYYADITIDAALVDEAIPVIPVFLSPGDSTFWTTVTSEDDVVFYDDTGTLPLDFYRVAFTDSGSSGTGLFLVNVDGIISTSTDETIRVYFGDSAATDRSNGFNTFNLTYYQRVYFPGMSTSNVANPGTGDLTAVNSPGTTASGYEGLTAATYNGSSQYHYTTLPSVTDWAATVEGLLAMDSHSSNQDAVSLSNSSTFPSYLRLYINTTPRFISLAQGASGSSATATDVTGASDSTYYWVGSSNNGSNGYINVANVGSGTASVTLAAATFNSLNIGALRRGGSVSGYFDGNVAAAWISSVVRSNDYINTMGNAWNDAGFLTWGASTASSGPTSVSGYFQTAGTTADGGDVNWTNTSNATGSNTATYASCALNDEYSYRLELTNADLTAIPDDATIDSIEIDLYRSANGSGRIVDIDVYLMVAGSEFGSNKFNATQWGTSPTAITYTWSSGFPTVAQVKASTFGISLTCNETDADDRTARIHYGYVTVNFTTGGGGGSADGSFFFK